MGVGAGGGINCSYLLFAQLYVFDQILFRHTRVMAKKRNKLILRVIRIQKNIMQEQEKDV